MNSPTGQTRRRVSRLMAQTMRTRARMCLLWVSLTLLPILGVKSPEYPNFWGVNMRFQAKQAKYWKFHVIETTASISTTFGTTIETIKKSPWVLPIGPNKSKMADGRHFEKKTVKSLYLCNCLTDFDKIWYSDAYWPLTANFWKCKMAAAANLKNHRNRDISVTVWPIFTKYGTLMQNVSLNRSDY